MGFEQTNVTGSPFLIEDISKLLKALACISADSAASGGNVQ
jgi:hypothetical protein